jgi:hypothetical protein
MRDEPTVDCPECRYGPDRRSFLQAAAVAGPAALLGPRPLSAAPASAAPARPAEDLVKELFATLTADQKKELVLPYDHGKPGALPTRLGMYNSPIDGKRIAAHYTPAQQELVERILRAIANGEDGYHRLSRGGTFDSSGSLKGCGALLFGEPKDGKPWSWVFSGHHLTVRCDGRPADGVGFGGPMYYGHSPNGYSDKNVFAYQTKAVMGVFEALSEKQRAAAAVVGSPGEQYPSVKFRPADQARPGVPVADLSLDQRALVVGVMRELLSPFRKEDADEVMAVVKNAGGPEAMHLAFYKPKAAAELAKWSFWRLEGPGFVWNFRVLPHVHTFVNVEGKA